MLAVVNEAWLEVLSAVQQMTPADDKIISDHVKSGRRFTEGARADSERLATTKKLRKKGEPDD